MAAVFLKMNRSYRMRNAMSIARRMEFSLPSAVASLPSDVYGERRIPYEGPLDVEPPIFDLEKAEQRARRMAEEFRQYVVIEGAAVRASCDGEELEAELLEVDE